MQCVSPSTLASDDLNCSMGQLSPTSRKALKPLMERKRRARMNTCLDELRALLKDSPDYRQRIHERTEKADILSMAVQYIVELRQEGATHGSATGDSRESGNAATVSGGKDSFSRGFAAGVTAAIGAIESSTSLDASVKQDAVALCRETLGDQSVDVELTPKAKRKRRGGSSTTPAVSSRASPATDAASTSETLRKLAATAAVIDTKSAAFSPQPAVEQFRCLAAYLIQSQQCQTLCDPGATSSLTPPISPDSQVYCRRLVAQLQQQRQQFDYLSPWRPW